MQMISLTINNFKIEAENSRGIVVVMFFADWCGKCSMMKPVVEDVARKYDGKIKFCKVNIEESPQLAEQYAATIVPTFVIFKDGEVEMYMQGLLDEYIFEQRIRELLY